MADELDKPIFKRSCCPITCLLHLLGDKRTLLVIRDLLLGKKHFQEFLESPERIATNQQKPVRYEYILTKKGEDLNPVLQTLVKWGKTYCSDTKMFEAVERQVIG